MVCPKARTHTGEYSPYVAGEKYAVELSPILTWISERTISKKIARFKKRAINGEKGCLYYAIFDMALFMIGKIPSISSLVILPSFPYRSSPLLSLAARVICNFFAPLL